MRRETARAACRSPPFWYRLIRIPKRWTNGVELGKIAEHVQAAQLLCKKWTKEIYTLGRVFKSSPSSFFSKEELTKLNESFSSAISWIAKGLEINEVEMNRTHCDEYLEQLSSIVEGSDGLDALTGEVPAGEAHGSLFDKTRESVVEVFQQVKGLAETRGLTVKEPKGALARAIAKHAAKTGGSEQ